MQSYIQYDDQTRKLWEELQKPYGNSSSFLRHLIILEKFYRNGDLILSPKASNNSTSYNSCVQNRLKSYDNFSPNKSIAQFDETVNKTQKHLNNNDFVAMTNKPKDNNKKSFQNIRFFSNNQKNRMDNKETNSAINKSLGSTRLYATSDMPPELISISKTADNLSSSTSKAKPNALKNTSQIANVIKLPDTLTSQERLSSKNWRPTLIPLTSTTHLNQQGPLYLTADGRRLPALVQVQSSGKPFLISIHDYNRMCILRREKLLRDQMLKANNLNAPNGTTNPQISQSSKRNQERMNSNYRMPSATTTSSVMNRPSTSSFDSTNVVPSTLILPISSKNLPFNNIPFATGSGQSNNMKANLLLKDRELLSKIPKNLTVIPQLKSHTISNASLAGLQQSNSSLVAANIKNSNFFQEKKKVEKH